MAALGCRPVSGAALSVLVHTPAPTMVPKAKQTMITNREAETLPDPLM